MTRAIALTAFLLSLSASAQCSQPALVEDWSDCGSAIQSNTQLGKYFGVQDGDSLRMDRPLNLATGLPAQRSIRLYQCEGGYLFIRCWRCDWDDLPNDQSTNHGQ